MLRFIIIFISFLILYGCGQTYAQPCACKVQGVNKDKKAILLSSSHEYQLLSSLTGLSLSSGNDSLINKIYFSAGKLPDSVSGIKWFGHIYSPVSIVLKYDKGLAINISPCEKTFGQYYSLPIKLNINKVIKKRTLQPEMTAYQRFDYAIKVTELSWKDMLLRLAYVAPKKHPVSKFFNYLNNKYNCAIPQPDKAGLRPDEFLDSAVACLLKAKVDLPLEVYEQYLKSYEGEEGKFNPVFERAYFCLTRRADQENDLDLSNAVYDLRLKDENIALGFSNDLFKPQANLGNNKQSEIKFLDVKSITWNDIRGLNLQSSGKICFPLSEIGSTGVSIAFDIAYPDLSILYNEFRWAYHSEKLDEIGSIESEREQNKFIGVLVPEANMNVALANKPIKMKAREVLISYNSIAGNIYIEAERAEKKKVRLKFKDTSLVLTLKELQKEFKKKGFEADVFYDDPLSTGYYYRVIIRFKYQAKQ